MTACVCGDPPSISNGELRFSGTYLNGTKAEYDCDSGYTQAGGDSLLCFAGTSCTGPEPNWIVDTSDSNSGYPDCQAVVPDYDVYNTFNQLAAEDSSSSSGLDSWAIFGLLLALLLLLFLIVLLLLWYWCCRECCRRCCMRSCPCCRDCCYEIPYGHHPHGERPVGKRITAVTTHNNSQYVGQKQVQSKPQPKKVVLLQSDPPANSPPITPRTVNVQVVERSPNGENDDYYRKHLGYKPSSQASGLESKSLESKEFQDDTVELIKAEPKDFVYVEDEKLHVPQGKPMDSKGQPVWMPHANQVRKFNTSTK